MLVVHRLIRTKDMDSSELKSKHLVCPLVAGCSIGHVSRWDMRSN